MVADERVKKVASLLYRRLGRSGRSLDRTPIYIRWIWYDLAQEIVKELDALTPVPTTDTVGE